MQQLCFVSHTGSGTVFGDPPIMPTGDKQKHKHLASLSRLMFNGYSAGFGRPTEDLRPVYPQLECIPALNENELAEFVHVADLNPRAPQALRGVRQAASC